MECNVQSTDQDQPMDPLDLLLAEMDELMRMKFSEVQMRKLHCLRLHAILQLKSDEYYIEDKNSEKGKRLISICYRSLGITPSPSPEDYLPIVNVITCGRITNVFEKQNHRFIIIEDAGSQVMCRFDRIPDPEPPDTEDDQPLENVSENTKLLLNAIDRQKDELVKKLTEVQMQKESIDLLNHYVQVEGKLTFINNNQQLVILINSCFIIDDDELKAFHHMCRVREKYDISM